MTPEKDPAAMVMGRGATGPDRPRSSVDSVKFSWFLDFLLLSVETPESLELRVEEGKSALVSRKPGQISLTLI